jgi:preprotein translocase subunit SecD
VDYKPIFAEDACGGRRKMNIDELWEDRKIKILVAFVVFSLVLITFNGITKGIDLEGGSRVNLKTERALSQREMTEMISVMEARLNAFGLKDIRVNSLGEDIVQIEIAGVSPDEAIEILGRPGRLTVKVGNETVFTGAELERVEPFGKNPQSGSWMVPFTLSEDAALRFMDVAVANNFPPVYMYMDESTQIRVVSTSELTDVDDRLKENFGLESNINASLGLTSTVTYIRFDQSVDEFSGEDIESITAFINESYEDVRFIAFESTGLVNSAPIGQSLREELLAGQQVRSLILEVGQTESARKEAEQIEAILRSGSLSVKVEVIEKLRVPPELGDEFVKNAILAGFVAIVAVALVVLVRYRDTRIVIPIIATGFSEVIIILGIASLIRWNIDLPAIAGIIAAVGTGVDDQIVITDEVFLEKEKSLRHRMKSAFFIIMAAWMTTVAAMFPLFSIGLQILRGFAITTIIGVTIGVFITRPAYATLIRQIIGDE